MREEKTDEELYAGFNEGYETFPKTFKWKKALEFAKQKHKGQVRDGGTPYFEHIKEVMNILVKEDNTTDDIILTVAALHDVLENTDCTKEELEDQFGTITAECVDLLTRKEGQSYADYARQVFTNEDYLIIRQIKLADELHNLRTLRLTNNSEKIIKKIQETEECILNYEKCAPRNLMNKIKQELDTLKSTPSDNRVNLDKSETGGRDIE